ncbi:MAG: peptidoglycan-binding protein, partial [Porticoccaceae bacterium]
MLKKYTPLAALCTLLWLSLPALAGETGLDYADLPAQVCPEQPLKLAPALRTVAEGMPHRDLWRASDSLHKLATELRTLADDGLYLDQYHVSWLETRRGGDDLDACDALLASQILVQALSDLALGRIDPHRAELVWYRHPVTDEDRARILSALVASGDDPQALIQAARPVFAPYQHLRAAYVAARDNPPRQRWPEVPAGPSLREGDTDGRVALLRARLAAEGYTAAEAAVVEHFDVGLGDAVKAFQRRHGLAVDGVAGRKTLAELNRDAGQRLARMRVNLERLRWLARDMAPRALVVDITAARVMYYRGGELAWTNRAQMGMASRTTPALVSSLTHVTLNPTWTVPPTILRNDKLPEIRKDISYLA